MKNLNSRGLIRLTLILLVVLIWLAGASWSKIAAQGPPRPDPPPDVPGPPPGRNPPPTPGGAGGGGGGGGDGYSYRPCMTVHGEIVNWGYHNEPKVPVILRNSDWQTEQVADDNGYYASYCLGIGIALLNPMSPPWLRPMTEDVPIRLGYRQSFEVNFGLYSNRVMPVPEVVPLMTVNTKQVQPGENVIYTIHVANTLSPWKGSPASMGDVMVTDLLPETLTPVSASSTPGKVELWGNLMTADIGTLPPGQEVTIVVTAKVLDDTPPATLISNRASLLHTEHVAVQTPIINVIVGP